MILVKQLEPAAGISFASRSIGGCPEQLSTASNRSKHWRIGQARRWGNVLVTKRHLHCLALWLAEKQSLSDETLCLPATQTPTESPSSDWASSQGDQPLGIGPTMAGVSAGAGQLSLSLPLIRVHAHSTHCKYCLPPHTPLRHDKGRYPALTTSRQKTHRMNHEEHHE